MIISSSRGTLAWHRAVMEDERVSYDTRSGCMHCGSLTFSNEYYNAFKVDQLRMLAQKIEWSVFDSCTLPFVVLSGLNM